jgi:very-short-patch-repair endonuclease
MPNPSQHELSIITRNTTPTREALLLKDALEDKGITVYKELHDGFKTIDLALPKAKINIEVDGIQHLTNPKQILADLERGYYSHKNGYDTMHIPNEMIRLHLPEISTALAEAAKTRQKRLYIGVD